VELPRGVLCYASGNCAFFTTAPLNEQWGDDWNDAPYEHNAGEPYVMDGFAIHKVYFNGPYETPADRANGNSSYSVQDINNGNVAWLMLSSWPGSKRDVPPIFAGTEYAEFVRKVNCAGGTVYAPITQSTGSKEE
jgi:hypothetical protein